MASHARATLAGGALFLFAGGAIADPALISKWRFDGEPAGGNAVRGAPEARVERADLVEGHEGKALAFEDWSVKSYLRPDPKAATRASVPHDPRLNPPFPFRLSAWIYPTADPIYYGGIVEKGRGYGASYRLVLLRGLKLQASLGDQHVSVRSPSPLSLNAWHEIAMMADGRSLVLTVDGKEAARAPIPPAIRLASSDALVIGERFTGRIDDVTLASE